MTPYVDDGYWLDGYVEAITAARGDDAYRSHGARAALWATKAEEWLQERLDDAVEAASKPAKARKRFVATFAEQIETRALAPQLSDPVAALVERLTAPIVDYTAFAIAAQAEIDRLNKIKTRRRRDAEALLAMVM